MQEILELLVRWFPFLWEGGRYRIDKSMVSTSFGGDAYLVVSSNVLRMRFVRDRGQVFLDFQEPWAIDKAEWYSVDLIRRLITGESQRSAELDESFATFIRQSLTEIEGRFSSKEAFEETKSRLSELKKLRAREMFR